jgi:nucleotidyltransferase/DNA polymerase involved in DNA repair
MFACIIDFATTTGPANPADLAAVLLDRAPRIRIDAAPDQRSLIWADARGLHARSLADTLLGILRAQGCPAPHAGVASTPVAAQIAALHGAKAEPITAVPPGTDRDWLAPFPITVLTPSTNLLNLLEGTGVERCGDLARLDQASVELRFGADGVALWRLARADDRRLLFGPPPPPLPHASLEWTDYALRDPERLLFVINRLAGSVTAALHELGRGARTFTLAFTLDRGGAVEHAFHPSRPNADQRTWMRLVRDELERVRLPDAVAGVALRVDAVLPSASVQGDLLDRGFATAAVAETALARVLDERSKLLTPLSSRHPLLRRRTVWREEPAALVWRRTELRGSDVEPRLALYLLPEPEPVEVETAIHRGFAVPVRYFDHAGPHDLLGAQGPDCVSGGDWEETYAVELFCCVRADGELVRLARDARRDIWTLEGGWR